MVDALRHPNKEVKIALVGKYIALHDAYISVVEALKHGGIAEHATVNIKWVDSEELTPENIDEYLGDVSGILVPGGFGSRGVEGKFSQHSMPVNTRFLTLVSALVCRLPSSNLQDMSVDSTMLTVLSLIQTQHIRSSL